MKKKLITAISKANKVLIQFETVIMVITLVAILILFAATIILRSVFKSDFPGMEEIVMGLSVWMYMMGCGVACHTESHVSADLIKSFIKKRVPRLIHRVWLYSICTFIGAYFLILSIQWISFQATLKPVSTVWRFPLMIPYLSVPFGFTFSTIYFAAHLLWALYSLITGRGNGGEKLPGAVNAPEVSATAAPEEA